MSGCLVITLATLYLTLAVYRSMGAWPGGLREHVCVTPSMGVSPSMGVLPCEIPDQAGLPALLGLSVS